MTDDLLLYLFLCEFGSSILSSICVLGREAAAARGGYIPRNLDNAAIVRPITVTALIWLYLDNNTHASASIMQFSDAKEEISSRKVCRYTQYIPRPALPQFIQTGQMVRIVYV